MSPSIVLSSEEQTLLGGFTRRRNSPQWLVQRSTILLRLAEGVAIRHVARSLDISRNTVRLWRDRWQNAPSPPRPELDPESSLEARMILALSDQPRPGTPPTFGPEVAVQIVALACRSPEEFGPPISHWTPRELAEEAVKQGIVSGISAATATNFLKGGQVATASQCLPASSQHPG